MWSKELELVLPTINIIIYLSDFLFDSTNCPSFGDRNAHIWLAFIQFLKNYKYHTKINLRIIDAAK